MKAFSEQSAYPYDTVKTEEICENLYRILIPFEDIYTTAYVVLNNKKAAVIDSGACDADAERCIFPALKEIGIQQNDVRYLLLTHSHGDHAGGIGRLAELFPQAEIRASYAIGLPHFSLLKDREIILSDLQAIYLPGHVNHAVGYLHLPSGTLLSGDCLQLSGIGKYRKNIADRERYEQSVKSLQKLEIKRIVAAHEFDPLGSIAEGEEAVREYLEMCLKLW